jgi:hypothetical protein
VTLLAVTQPDGYRGRSPWRTALALLAAVALLGAAGVVGALFVMGRVGGSEAPVVACAPSATGPLPPSQVQVRVRNGAARAGLAAGVATQLRQRQFTVVAVDNHPERVPVPARLVFGPAGDTAAPVLAGQLLGAEVIRDGRTDATVDLLLGDGFERLRSPEEVAAAAAAAAAAAGSPAAGSPNVATSAAGC